MNVSDSSSEDENADRVKAAVWSFSAGSHNSNTDGAGGSNIKHSKRMKAVEHQNELDTTPEFRSHIAKKLETMLDSRISVEAFETSRPDEGGATEKKDPDQDDGFRLFSTSLPGKWQEVPNPPPPPKRRPAPSSSESDSEKDERLREAAVSLSDLLPPSTVPTNLEERGTRAEGDRSSKKKKKKLKAPMEDSGRKKGGDEGDEQDAEEKLKKKKKKKQKASLVLTGEQATDKEPSGRKNPVKKKKIRLDGGLEH